MKKFLKFLLVLIVLGAAGFYGWQYYQHKVAAPVSASADAQDAYTEYTVGRGTLTKTVTGTGTLSIARVEEIELPYAVTVTDTLVEEGDTVAAGQPLMTIDTAALQTTIDTLQSELDTTESEIASLSNDYTSAEYIKLNMDCRVKEVYIQNGDYIEDVMAEKGAIALLSLDGLMVVDVPVIEGLDILDTMKVTVGRNTVSGTVRAISGDIMTISFSDEYGEEGQEVTIRVKNEPVATGTCSIHMPYYLTTSAQGYIELVNLEVNAKKYSGNRICYLNNIPMSATYDALQATRATQQKQLTEMKKLLKAGVISATEAGIVSTIAAPSAAEQAAYTVLASLYVGDEKEMVISVDELDITSVSVGQNVDVAMDAIEDKTYPAKVTKVSQIGTASGGVTVYNVTLTIEGDERLRFGMNGTATIHIEERSNVLLVPLTALNSSRGESYVWLKSAEASADEPGVRTTIETGLSDESYAEVISGLSEGDVILITREASEEKTNGFSFGGGMGNGMMNFGGGQMPSMPSGGSNFGGGNRGGSRP